VKVTNPAVTVVIIPENRRGLLRIRGEDEKALCEFLVLQHNSSLGPARWVLP
jgi:hypothetical protein